MRRAVTRVRVSLLALVVAVLGGATGCEKDRTPPPATTCTKVAELCKLPSGPLGVCNMVDCPAGATPPCLKCTPQH